MTPLLCVWPVRSLLLGHKHLLELISRASFNGALLLARIWRKIGTYFEKQPYRNRFSRVPQWNP